MRVIKHVESPKEKRDRDYSTDIKDQKTKTKKESAPAAPAGPKDEGESGGRIL